MDMKTYEAICFRIISYAGTAKSCFLEAIECAKQKQEFENLLNEGNQAFLEASKAHHQALSMESNREMSVGLLLVHAETILSGAEIIRDLSATIIELIKQSHIAKQNDQFKK